MRYIISRNSSIHKKRKMTTRFSVKYYARDPEGHAGDTRPKPPGDSHGFYTEREIGRLVV